MAWWRLVLSCVPALEAALDPWAKAGGFTWMIVIYSLTTVIAANVRFRPMALGWLFAFGDLILLHLHVHWNLANRPLPETAFSFVAVALIIMATNSLRLSLPLLWTSSALLLAGYLWLLAGAADNIRPLVGGFMLMLIGLALATMIVRSQTRLLAETRARARLRRFVSAEIADEMERKHLALDQPTSSEVTVLFLDIRGFSRKAETMDAVATVAFLNHFFGLVTQVIFRHRGTVDKFVGDGVMALFGAPLHQADAPARACAAALEIVEAVHGWNSKLRSQGQSAVQIGIGINTAVVVAGVLGTPQKLEYTAVGDGVNVAARLCALAGEKDTPPILAAASTRHAVPSPMPWIELGEVTLRGRVAPLAIYGLGGRGES